MSDFYCSECQIVWAGDYCRNCSPPIEADDQRVASKSDATGVSGYSHRYLAELWRKSANKAAFESWRESNAFVASVYDNPDAVVHVEDPIVRLLTAQIQDANKQITELERQLKVLMHSAAHPPAIEEEPEEFPANALRYSA